MVLSHLAVTPGTTLTPGTELGSGVPSRLTVQRCGQMPSTRPGQAWSPLSPPQPLVRVLMTGNCQQREGEGEGRKEPELVQEAVISSQTIMI